MAEGKADRQARGGAFPLLAFVYHTDCDTQGMPFETHDPMFNSPVSVVTPGLTTLPQYDDAGIPTVAHQDALPIGLTVRPSFISGKYGSQAYGNFATYSRRIWNCLVIAIAMGSSRQIRTCDAYLQNAKSGRTMQAYCMRRCSWRRWMTWVEMLSRCVV